MIRAQAPALDPAEALRRLQRGERAFLLDGGGDAVGLSRYSLAGCDPDDGFSFRRGDEGRPLELLEAAHRRFIAGPIESQPWPLAVGYLSYDLGEALIAAPAGRRFSAEDDLGLPLIDFARYRAVWRYDRVERRAEVLALDGASAERLLTRLARTPPPLPACALTPPRWETGDDRYLARVRRVLDYLQAGDAYQVNLSHRLKAQIDDQGALPLYLRLRERAPAPLGAFLSLGSAEILCNSPELLLRSRLSAGRWELETRPIKGTRRRGASPEEDARLALELDRSEKDRAEHLMIVDLERNDLGRVAETGSVAVDGFGRRLTLPTVHHLVSTVRAQAHPRLGLAQLISAVFPGGSVTGAPKLRAMEIIDELEGVRRGPYCGAIGWLGPGLTLDLALPIRTAIVRSGELTLSVGGGIVADSDPNAELDETRIKAEAFLRALG